MLQIYYHDQRRNINYLSNIPGKKPSSKDVSLTILNSSSLSSLSECFVCRCVCAGLFYMCVCMWKVCLSPLFLSKSTLHLIFFVGQYVFLMRRRINEKVKSRCSFTLLNYLPRHYSEQFQTTGEIAKINSEEKTFFSL